MAQSKLVTALLSILQELDTRKNLPLFELACLGSEESIQGELLVGLRNKGYKAAIEAGYQYIEDGKSTRRRFDLFVFDDSKDTVIELKHFSRNQGSAETLWTGIDDDYKKTKKITQYKLIQIGFYTTIKEGPDVTIPHLYSLLSYYSRQIGFDDENFTSCVQDHYRNEKLDDANAIITGTQKSFTTDKKTYTGKVSYFVLER
jgi:hypothetical protein